MNPASGQRRPIAVNLDRLIGESLRWFTEITLELVFFRCSKGLALEIFALQERRGGEARKVAGQLGDRKPRNGATNSLVNACDPRPFVRGGNPMRGC